MKISRCDIRWTDCANLGFQELVFLLKLCEVLFDLRLSAEPSKSVISIMMGAL